MSLKLRSLPTVHLARPTLVANDKETSAKTLRFLIIEDLPIFGVSLAEVISSNFNAHVQVVSDVRKALDICATEKLDIILIGVSAPERSGLSSVAECDRFCANCPVLIVSLLPAEDFVPRALKACAAGYIMKSTSANELVCAVGCLLKGGKYVSGKSRARLAGAMTKSSDERLHESLSVRELDVFMRIARGSTAKEIAGDLFLSVKTVSTHHTHIFRKLHVRTDAQLGEYAIRNRLIA